jgi:hypothetical protein
MEITKNKIHMLGYRFSVDFFIHTLEYDFLLGNHKHLAKACMETFGTRIFLFFSWDFKNP